MIRSVCARRPRPPSTALLPSCWYQYSPLPSRCHTHLGISHRSRPQSSRQASWTRSAADELGCPWSRPRVSLSIYIVPIYMAVIPFARWPALPLRQRKRRRVMSSRELHARANGFELHGRRSPRDGRLAPAARQRVCACASFQCGRPLRRGHRRWPRGSCLAAGGEAACGAQSAPGGRFTRSLLACRAPRARYSV